MLTEEEERERPGAQSQVRGAALAPASWWAMRNRPE